MSISKIEISILTLFLGMLVVPAFLPPTLWFSASVHVPDHKVGGTPIVDYVREIKKFGVLTWNVEIEPAVNTGVNRQFCTGSDTNVYTPKEGKSLPLPLNEYAGVETCALPVGRYIMNTCWRWTVWGVYQKQFCTTSNEFQVVDSP